MLRCDIVIYVQRILEHHVSSRGIKFVWRYQQSVFLTVIFYKSCWLNLLHCCCGTVCSSFNGGKQLSTSVERLEYFVDCRLWYWVTLLSGTLYDQCDQSWYWQDWEPFTSSQNTVTNEGNGKITEHEAPAPDLGNSKVIPMVCSLAHQRLMEQLGNLNSWEHPRSPTDPRCSFLPSVPTFLSCASFFFIHCLSLSPMCEKKNKKKTTGKDSFQLWVGCFRQLLLSPSFRYCRCSQSYTRMSESCKWHERDRNMLWLPHFECKITRSMHLDVMNRYDHDTKDKKG